MTADPIPKGICKAIEELAGKIETEVPFQLWDECVELLMDKLSGKADKSGQPISVFFTAEVMLKLKKTQKNSRYVADINSD